MKTNSHCWKRKGALGIFTCLCHRGNSSSRASVPRESLHFLLAVAKNMDSRAQILFVQLREFLKLSNEGGPCNLAEIVVQRTSKLASCPALLWRAV